MEIDISCRHGHLRESDETEIREKLQKLPHLFSRIQAIELVIDWNKHEHHQCSEVEIIVDCEHRQFVVSASNDDMELIPAFDMALNKAERQLRKYHDKVTDHRRK